MTRAELEAMVPVRANADGKLLFVCLRDIPFPYRAEFAADSWGSTRPIVGRRLNCHYVWDWHKWLSFRFDVRGYVPLFKDCPVRAEDVRDAALDEADRQYLLSRLRAFSEGTVTYRTLMDSLEIASAEALFLLMAGAQLPMPELSEEERLEMHANFDLVLSKTRKEKEA